VVFVVKYDLRHKARLLAGGNWTVNDKEDIYSGVLRMDTVRIGVFLGGLYGLSCCACDIGNAFLYGKTKEKVYINVVPEFGANLHDKIL
jgi:hypothetical protein